MASLVSGPPGKPVAGHSTQAPGVREAREVRGASGPLGIGIGGRKGGQGAEYNTP